MTRTTGKLAYVNLSQIIYDLPKEWECQPMFPARAVHKHLPNRFYGTNKFLKYKYDLHEKLRLNLTIMKLHIPAKFVHYNICLSGFLSVSSTQSSSQHTLLYCGYLAFTSSCPKSKQVEVEVKAKPLVIVEAEVSFCVVDHNDVISTGTASNSTGWAKPQWAFVFPTQHLVLTIYHIKASPINKILVSHNKTTVDRVQVFDGPGPESAALQPREERNSCSVFLSSAFFVTIYHYTIYHCTSGYQQGNLAITFTLSSLKVFDESVGHNATRIVFPNPNCCEIKPVCLIKLKTQVGKRLNITLNNMEHKGETNTEDCKYAGLWISEHFHNVRSLKEIYHGCVKEFYDTFYKQGCYIYKNTTHNFKHSSGKEKNHSSLFYINNISTKTHVFLNKSQYQSIYSNGNEVVVAHYSFEEYATLSLNLDVSHTSCVVIHADICQLHSHPKLQLHSPFFEVRSLPKINLSSGFGFQGKRMLLSGWDHKCIVFQLKAAASPHENFCNVQLEIPRHKDKIANISLSATGFIQGETFCAFKTVIFALTDLKLKSCTKWFSQFNTLKHKKYKTQQNIEYFLSDPTLTFQNSDWSCVAIRPQKLLCTLAQFCIDDVLCTGPLSALQVKGPPKFNYFCMEQFSSGRETRK